MKRAFRQDRLGTNIGRVEGKAALSAGDLKHISGHIQDILTKIQSRLQWGSDKYDCSDVERLAAEQNCEVLNGTLCPLFTYINDHFTKTGPGQT